MSFVRELGCERIARIDEATGIRVTQMTSFPTMSGHFYYEHPSFTSDSSTLVMRSQREPSRTAPWDLLACDSDGGKLRQITDEDDADNFAVGAIGHIAWYQRGTVLWCADLDTGERREIAPGPDGVEPMRYYAGCVSPDGRYYFGYGRQQSDGHGVVIRYDTDGTDAIVVASGYEICHLHVSPGGHGISYGGLDEQGDGAQNGVDYDGTNLRVLPTADLSHFTWIGRERRYLGCGMHPHPIINTRGDGEAESTVIVNGSFFWHSGLSYNADWTVADINWPNEGIMVVNIPARQYARLCVSAHSGGHSKTAHAHPAFSCDGSMVVFTSDRTGVMQVYVAEVPPMFKDYVVTPNPGATPGGRLPEWRVS